MQSPNAVLIITKRKLAGPDLPDFGGESYPEARKGAMIQAGGCPGMEMGPEEVPKPDSEPERGYSDQLAEVKRLAGALQAALDALGPPEEGDPPPEGEKGQQEATYGEQKELS